MGAYLNTPVCEKEQEEDGNERITYASTSMQGWRTNQEDAHNCILDFYGKCSLFAVYDGHGGSEVAIFISKFFPDFLKNEGVLDSDDISEALKKCFIKFDASLVEDQVVRVMDSYKEKAEASKPQLDEEGEREALLEEAVALSNEASVGLGTIIKQYMKINRRMQQGSFTDKSEKRTLGEPSSRLVKRRKICRENATIVEDDDQVTSQTVLTTEEEVNGETKSDSLTEKQSEGKLNANNKVNGSSDAEVPEKLKNNGESEVDAEPSSKDENVGGEKPGCGDRNLCDMGEPSRSTAVDDNDAIADEEEDDEDYDPDEEEEEQMAEGSEEDNDESDDCELITGRNKAGFDSGATACVSLLFPDKVVVANIGDSRAVMCRDGVAVDLSTDHKPEDPSEKSRIEAAGGSVSDEGRVNGGLNLSRAFGDHFYKQRPDLPMEKQMITASPDVLISELTDKDTFLIIACDGIWNSMSSQDVVNFINDQIAEKSLKEIAAEICDHCCAPDTSGDGTGCDNMTIIIVDLKNPKRNTAESTS